MIDFNFIIQLVLIIAGFGTVLYVCYTIANA